MKRFINILFRINYCFSSRLKINRSKFYVSIFFVISKQNFRCYLIFRKTTRNFGNYFRDELSDDKNDNNNLNKSVIEPKSFKYKTSITRSIYNIVKNITDVQGNEIYNPAYDEKKKKNGTKDVEIVVPLTSFNNFWRTLHIPLINCEVS